MARILHLIAANHRRGAETFAVELAEHLRGVGHEVRVLAVSDSRTHNPLDVEVAGRTRYDALGARRIVEATSWSDVVVSFGSSSLLIGAAAAKLVGRPFVYRNIGDPSVWGQAPLAGLRVGVPVRSACRVVALYPDAARTLTERYGLHPERVRIIPRGVPADRFPVVTPADELDARAHLELDASMRWIAYVGALSDEKDPLLAVAALSMLPDDVGLVVAGGGPLEQSVRHAAGRFGDRVRMLGVRDDVATVYAASDALVLPSRTEGIPGAAVEASLCGRPVVSFDVGGVSSVVLDDLTGKLATDRSAESFAAAIDDVLDRADTMGAAARRHSQQHFSMEVVGARWEQVIDEALLDRAPAKDHLSALQVTASADRRGAEVFAGQLAPDLERRGFTVHTVALSRSRQGEPLPFKTLGTSRWHPLTLIRLRRAIKQHDVTIVHGGAGLWPTALMSLSSRRPFVYRSIGEPRFWGDVPLGSVRIGTPLRRAGAVIALYGEAGRELVDLYSLDPARVTVIANAVPTSSFPLRTATTRATARGRLGLETGEFVVGYVGALSDEKRPEWAVGLLEAIDDVHVVLVGSGPLEGSLRSAAPVGDRFHLAGAVADPSTLLPAFDLLVLPSATEGMPASIIESALVGVPVVATDVGAVQEVVSRLSAGTTVPRDDRDAFVDAVRSARSTAHPLVPDRDAAVRIYDIGVAGERWAEVLRSIVEPSTPTRTTRPRRSGSSLVRLRWSSS